MSDRTKTPQPPKQQPPKPIPSKPDKIREVRNCHLLIERLICLRSSRLRKNNNLTRQLGNK